MQQSSADQVLESTSSRPGSNTANADTAANDEGYEEVDDENEADVAVITDGLNGIRYVWANKVPDRLIKLVVAAAKANQFSSNSANSVCDLFVSRDEWVREAWNVFILQEDESDFIDTITRILRHKKVIENVGNTANSLPESQSSLVSTSTSLPAVAPSSSSAFSSVKQSATKPSTNVIEPSKLDPTLEKQQNQLKAELAHTQNEQARVLKSKEEAIIAIQAAKQELLKHSLDMMVRSDLMTQFAADKLLNSATDNNSQLDEAIDAYAQTRNISAFLGTLQTLSASLATESAALVPLTIKSKPIAAITPIPVSANPAATTATTSSSAPATASSQTREQEELTQIILELSRSNIVDPSGSTRLLGLIRNQDADLLQCYNTLL